MIKKIINTINKLPHSVLFNIIYYKNSIVVFKNRITFGIIF